MSHLGHIIFDDLSDQPRLPIMLRMGQVLMNARDDRTIVEEFSNAMREAYGSSAFIMARTRDLPPGSFRLTRWLDLNGRELVPTVHTDAMLDSVPVHSGGLFAQIFQNDDPKVISDFSPPPGDPFFDLLSGHGRLRAVRLIEQSYHSDWLVLLDPRSDGEGKNVEDLVIRANMIAVVIRNLNIARALREANVWIEREIDQIAGIQRALLPQSLPTIAGTKLASSYGTYDRAGGDYYDLIRLPHPPTANGKHPERWLILIADASGHGPSAAVVVAMLHAILQSLNVIDQPAELLEHINTKLFARRIGSSFVTAWCGVYEPASGDLRFASAGHPIPLLHRAFSQMTETLDDVGGIPLGVLDRVGSREGVVNLRSGDTLLLYTDGVSESMSPNRELFGERRIRNVLGMGFPPDALIEGLKAELLVHQAGTRPSDDQTILALRRE